MAANSCLFVKQNGESMHVLSVKNTERKCPMYANSWRGIILMATFHVLSSAFGHKARMASVLAVCQRFWQTVSYMVLNGKEQGRLERYIVS